MLSEDEIKKIAHRDSIAQVKVMSETGVVTGGLVVGVCLAVPFAIVPPLALITGFGGWFLGVQIFTRIRDNQYNQREEYYQKAVRSLKYQGKLPHDL